MTDEPATRFRIFGGLALSVGDAEVELGPPLQQLVLAQLVVAGGAVVSVSDLVDAAWGEDPPSTAVNVIHRHVGQLRRLIEPGLPPRAPGRWLLRAGAGYRLQATVATSDLLRFRLLAGTARARARDGDGAVAVTAYLRALTVAARPPLVGLRSEWLGRPEFMGIEEERRVLAVEATALALDRTAATELLGVIGSIAVSAPLHEPLQAGFARLLARGGRRADAVAVLARARELLAEQLGVDPGAELRAAQREIANPDSSTPVEQGVPAQLPVDVFGFVERQQYTQLFATAAARAVGGSSPIVCVSGVGGVGKTALTVHAAHRISRHFPDGQLFLDMQGFDADREPKRPEDALELMLDALGSPAVGSPVTLEARIANFRSLVAGRRMLILLDNARNAEQVRPLLPGSEGCLTFITSRRQLTSLSIRENALMMAVEPMPEKEARALLDARLSQRAAGRDDSAALERICHWCGGLPLALAITAARAAAEPQTPLDVIAGALDDPSSRLEALSFGGAGENLGAAIDLSYRALSPDAARLFRTLAGYPSAIVPIAAAATIAAAPVATTRGLLSELSRASLIVPRGDNTFVTHDLLRNFAATRLDTAEREDIATSVFTYFATSARAAAQATGMPWVPDEMSSATAVAETFLDSEQAMSWFARERIDLLAVLARACQTGPYRHAAIMTMNLRVLMFNLMTADDVLAVALDGLRAAERGDDPALTAELRRLASTYLAYTGDMEGAMTELNAVLQFFERRGDAAGVAGALRSMSQVMWIRDPAVAVLYGERSVAAARQASDDGLLALSSDTHGRALCNAGRWSDAVPVYEEALRALPAGSPFEPFTCAGAAEAFMRTGNHQRAISTARRGLLAAPSGTGIRSEATLLCCLARSAWAANDVATTRQACDDFVRLTDTPLYETAAISTLDASDAADFAEMVTAINDITAQLRAFERG